VQWLSDFVVVVAVALVVDIGQSNFAVFSLPAVIITIIKMFLKARTTLILAFALFMPATTVTSTDAVSAFLDTNESNNSNKHNGNHIRRVQQQDEQGSVVLDAVFNKTMPTAAPTTAWRYAKALNLTCTQVCADAGAGACNSIPLNSFRTAAQVLYVVTVELAGQGAPSFPASAQVFGGEFGGLYPGEPMFVPAFIPGEFRPLVPSYYFNPSNVGILSRCEDRGAEGFRICCCGATKDCPLEE
jgi:hypothetical protein